MALVCKKCNKGIAIAKYYPKNGFIAGDKSGWGQYPLNTDSINIFFEQHSHDFDDSMWGGDQYELRYEMGENTWTYEEKDCQTYGHEFMYTHISHDGTEGAERICIKCGISE